ncbi:DNA polymerase Y family protein [Geminicoccaceae bacterium 1502E]|nr:DNA polymerase Y family protein [Geminicoccaceae bacterium 1502E]
MSGRWLSLWLPDWPIERALLNAARRGSPLSAGEPLALVLPERGVPRLVAVNPAARAHGLQPGLSLADARAILPGLPVRPADPAGDAAALASLALWCGRWSPLVAVDGAEGIILDITGCAHLFGGETALLETVRRRLEALGLTVRTGLAGRRAAAWAWARFGAGGLLGQERQEEVLAELPAAALRLPEETVAALGRLGFRQVGQLAALPRSVLLTRFGAELPAALDRLLGLDETPFVPLREPARFAARLSWAEPVGSTAALERALRRLLESLCGDLERACRGARRVRLGLHRVDGEVAVLEAAAGRPVRDPGHLFRLLAPRLDGLDAGFGIELMLLEALETAPLDPRQADLAGDAEEEAVARLADQLAMRLGAERVLRLEPAESHVPERAVRLLPATAMPALRPWLARQPRPLRLLSRPEPLEAVAPVPDGPPARLTWKRTAWLVAAAQGPERLLPEWWRPEDEGRRLRDYYRLTLEDGRALWVFREGAYGESEPPVWRLHGLFQ